VTASLLEQAYELRLLEQVHAVDAPVPEALPRPAQQAGGVVQLGSLVEADV
jgi:hypothetical protein